MGYFKSGTRMKPSILRDVASELQTGRLLLRCPRAGDGVAVHEAVVESLAALRAWPASLPWAMFDPSVAASETFCRESQAAFIQRTRLAYLAFERDSGRFVASTSLHNIDWRVPRFEVGYWCRSALQRQGYTREAVMALITYAQRDLGARRVEAFTDERNTTSRALSESVGLRLEGVLRNERTDTDGTLRNTCVYASVV
jgi:RimJ/RimL family protein N-acetyltransferase